MAPRRAAAARRLLPLVAAVAAALLLLVPRPADALFKATPTPAVANDSQNQEKDPKQKYTALEKPQEADELLIGWMGETYRDQQQHQANGNGGPDGAGAPNAPGNPRRGVPRVLSWNPRIMHFPGFLTDEECDELIRRAEPRLRRSGVVDSTTGASKVDDVRSSSGQFFSRGEFPVVKAVEERVAMWTQLPVDFGEGMQVLRYAKTQEYRPHSDYFTHPLKDENGGNRMATVLMYLSTPEKGGETIFPRVKAPRSQLDDPSFSDCAKKGLAVKARKGDAVLFWSIRPDGRFDPGSHHGGCPVVEGVKYAATKWIHVAHFAEGFEKKTAVKRLLHVPAPSPAPLWCKDDNALCEGWAEEGECLANPGWMVGTREHPGACLRSCGRCDVAAHLHVGEKQPPSWCLDTRPQQCEKWAGEGECEKNAVWMVGTRSKPGHCLRSCNACHLVAHLYKDLIAKEGEEEEGQGVAAAGGKKGAGDEGEGEGEGEGGGDQEA